MNAIQTSYSVCPLDCPDACGIKLSHTATRILSLKGDENHPVTAGFVCSKVRYNFIQKLDPRNRILTPLLRTGKKGEGKFTPLPLEQALRLAAEKIRSTIESYGPESILPFSYGGNMGSLQRPAGESFFHRLGSSKLLRTICSAAGSAGMHRHAGSFPGTDPLTAEHSDLIILWGINARVSSSHLIPVINKARKRGAFLIVIDVYKTATARMADFFLRIEPGKDANLALALAKNLVEQNGQDESFLRSCTTDSEEFKDYLSALDTDTLLENSGVGKEDLDHMLQWIKRSNKIFLRTGIGLTRNSRGESTIRSIASLAALLGLFTHSEAGRGFLFATGSFEGGAQIASGSHLQTGDPRSINMLHIGRALNERENPIKLLFIYNSNPLAVSPDRNEVKRGLLHESLFTIVHEQTMTETALYADLIIPATSSLENHDVYRSYGHHFLVVTNPVVNPPDEALSNFDLFQILARKLGLMEKEFQESIEERRVRYLQALENGGLPSGSDTPVGQPIRSTLPEKYETERKNGKWKFHFAADLYPGETTPFAHTGPLREFDDPELARKYPFKLITPPHRSVLNSTFSEFQTGPGEVLIHPLDAKEENIQNGWLVELESPRGYAIRVARITEDTTPGLFVAEGIFRGSDMHGGINNLTSDELTETAGGGVFHESRVRIASAKKQV